MSGAKGVEQATQAEVEGLPRDAGELARAAACYIEAARAVASTLTWINEQGPRFAAHQDDPEKRAAVLRSIEEDSANPLLSYYGRAEDGTVKAPGAPWIAWPWPGVPWHPANDVTTNLLKARALLTAEIDRLTPAAPGGEG